MFGNSWNTPLATGSFSYNEEQLVIVTTLDNIYFAIEKVSKQFGNVLYINICQCNKLYHRCIMDTTICRAHAQKLVCPCELLGLLPVSFSQKEFFSLKAKTSSSQIFPQQHFNTLLKCCKKFRKNWETENNTSRFDTCKIIVYLTGSTSLSGKFESPWAKSSNAATMQILRSFRTT